MQDTTLLQGDCLKLLRDIPDKSVDMVLCDPPFGTTCNRWDSVIPLPPLWENLERVCKENAAILLFSQMPFAAELVMSNKRMFRYEWIWQKTEGTGFLNAKKMPLKIHEQILVFYRSLPMYNPQMWQSHPYKRAKGGHRSTNYRQDLDIWSSESVDGKRYPVDIIRFKKQTGKHPTQKPVPLLEYLVKTYTNPGDVVLDPTMGSGSTGVACANTGRRFIGMELDAGYFAIAQQRIAEAQEQIRLDVV